MAGGAPSTSTQDVDENNLCPYLVRSRSLDRLAGWASPELT